jgi:glycosyltransferase involved in cell wall biosynthesis
MKDPQPITLFMPYMGVGGIERTVLNLLDELPGKYPEIDLVVATVHEQVMPRLPDTVRLVKLAARLPLGPLGKMLLPRNAAALGIFPSFVRYLRQRRPKAVLSFQASVLAVLAVKVARIDARIVVREANPSTVAFGQEPGMRRRLKLRMKRMAYSRADAVLAISQGVAADLTHGLGLPQGMIHVIYNPSFNPRISGWAKEPVDHPWLEADADLPVVISVGRLSHQKDFGTLIRAFAIVRERVASRLLIVGDGDLRGETEGLIRELGLEESADIVGFVDNPFRYMARSTVYAMSPRYEGLGNVYIEAQVCGLPIVSTDCPGGPREILLDGEAGLLVPVGDATAMAEGIVRYLESPELVAQHIAKGKVALTRFQSDLVAEQYLALLET